MPKPKKKVRRVENGGATVGYEEHRARLEARWARLQVHARQPTIGQVVDGAMEAAERDNPSLKGVLPRDYARPALDKQRLGQLIDLVTNIRVGDADARAKDVLGRVDEYFLGQFAPPPEPHGLRRLRAGQRLHVLQPVGRGRDPEEHR
jgi:type I restriction-modification system DNA methylase subunit